jgi:hypothetical protein
LQRSTSTPPNLFEAVITDNPEIISSNKKDSSENNSLIERFSYNNNKSPRNIDKKRKTQGDSETKADEIKINIKFPQN